MKRLTLLFSVLLCTTVFAVSLTKYRNTALLATAQLVKNSGGTVYAYKFINTDSAAAYVHLYDAKATADVTVGTTADSDVVAVPATSEVIVANTGNPQLPFTNGLVVAATTTATTAGSTAPAVGINTTILYQ